MIRIDRIDPPEVSQGAACSAQTGGDGTTRPVNREPHLLLQSA